jgi:hypothetical protein
MSQASPPFLSQRHFPCSKGCDEGTRILIQLLCFWTLSIVVFILNNVSDTGFCLRRQVKPTELRSIDTASSYLCTPAPTQDGVYKPSTAQAICES